MDRERYEAIRKRLGLAVQPVLDDLMAAPAGYVLLHCEGSGYRLCRPGKKPLKLRGAHRTLKRCLWSSERFGGKSTGKSVTRFSNGRTYYGSAGGLSRGKDVHEQVGNFVMLPRRQYCARYPEVDPMTKSVLNCLHRNGYRGLHAEFIVYDETQGLGTAVDLVCLDRNNRVVFVELKTGYHDAFLDTKKNAKLRGPFADIPDTPLNRARTQILFAQALYRRTHRLAPLGCVIHVDRDGTAVLFNMGPFANSQKSGDALLRHMAIRAPESHPLPPHGRRRARKRKISPRTTSTAKRARRIAPLPPSRPSF
ncbi:MAG: hypothetical protein LC650_01180 [Actinobacteria bacterium]|nr:hypothetical protein [Actinomycetota bacterium]